MLLLAFFCIFSIVICACDMFRLQCTVNFCLISNKYKNQQWTNMTVPQKQEFDLKEVNVCKKDYYFSKLGIYTLNIHHSKRDLDYIIPKGIDLTLLPNPKYIFSKGSNKFNKITTVISKFLSEIHCSLC
jgi:hypothetical protein